MNGSDGWQALCSDQGPALWFTEVVISDPLPMQEQQLRDIAKARSICAGCPGQRQCREDGEREEFGIWGGTTPAQRGFAGDSLEPRRYCAYCKSELPVGHRSAMHTACSKLFLSKTRKQKRASDSADRSCARCDVSLPNQARSCLICGHVENSELPERKWQW